MELVAHNIFQPMLCSPHRMGLQYFEALSPGTIASIVAVLANRLVTGNDVTGYFHYPFLKETLPSSVFVDAIVYGFFGCFIGIVYVRVVKKMKGLVHDWFLPPCYNDNSFAATSLDQLNIEPNQGEEKPLLHTSNIGRMDTPECAATEKDRARNIFSCSIRDASKRAAVSGALVGFIIGVIGIFVPHILFWGESQLQNLIDKGRTPLPVFGYNEEGATAAFTTFSYCMIDPNDAEATKNGFTAECSLLLMIAKTIVTGLSLGTGAAGGQFWGPLYVGCAAAHFLTDVCSWFDNRFSFGRGLARHPCVVILCTMGSAHVGKLQCVCCARLLNSSFIC